MNKFKWLIILLNLVLLLVYFSYSITQKEELLKEGQVVLLPLAPVDPRSLMQGDYMQLRYTLARDISYETIEKRGYCVVRIDSNSVATRVRFQKDITPLNEGERLINYTYNGNLNIGAESFFFQEGQAEKYDSAKYGCIKIDEHGNSLLIGLCNEQFKVIE